MQQASFRSAGSRASVSTRPGTPSVERSPRMIRGYDAKDAVLFQTPATKVARPSARQAIDAKAVKDRFAGLGARLVRVEIDAVHGAPADYVVAADGSLREGFRVDGKVTALFS